MPVAVRFGATRSVFAVMDPGVPLMRCTFAPARFCPLLVEYELCVVCTCKHGVRILTIGVCPDVMRDAGLDLGNDCRVPHSPHALVLAALLRGAAAAARAEIGGETAAGVEQLCQQIWRIIASGGAAPAVTWHSACQT